MDGNQDIARMIDYQADGVGAGSVTAGSVRYSFNDQIMGHEAPTQEVQTVEERAVAATEELYQRPACPVMEDAMDPGHSVYRL